MQVVVLYMRVVTDTATIIPHLVAKQRVCDALDPTLSLVYGYVRV